MFFYPIKPKPILPNISEKNIQTNELLKETYDGLKEKFYSHFKFNESELLDNDKFNLYKNRLDHEIKIILEMNYAGYF